MILNVVGGQVGLHIAAHGAREGREGGVVLEDRGRGLGHPVGVPGQVVGGLDRPLGGGCRIGRREGRQRAEAGRRQGEPEAPAGA